jgi:hypothetical protein
MEDFVNPVTLCSFDKVKTLNVIISELGFAVMTFFQMSQLHGNYRTLTSISDMLVNRTKRFLFIYLITN